jgi:hypothetical protein
VYCVVQEDCHGSGLAGFVVFEVRRVNSLSVYLLPT